MTYFSALDLRDIYRLAHFILTSRRPLPLQAVSTRFLLEFAPPVKKGNSVAIKAARLLT